MQKQNTDTTMKKTLMNDRICTQKQKYRTIIAKLPIGSCAKKVKEIYCNVKGERIFVQLKVLVNLF